VNSWYVLIGGEIMDRTVKSLLTVLLVLLLIVGVSIIPLPAEANVSVTAVPNQTDIVNDYGK
jgi:hypothetical protein